MSQKTWGGRFSGETNTRVELFTESISFDQRLYRQDILASQAHARMLAEVGVLTAAEAEQIVVALNDIQSQIERGEKRPVASQCDHGIKRTSHRNSPLATTEDIITIPRRTHSANC